MADRSKVKAPRSDAEVVVGVQRAMERDAWVDAAKIVVSCRRGVVTLEGNVGSLAERDAAEADAWGVAGVVDVDNRLAVKTISIGDDALADQIQRHLRKIRELDLSRVAIAVRDGIVTLRGAVPDPAQKATMALTTRGLVGVVDVVDALEVR